MDEVEIKGKFKKLKLKKLKDNYTNTLYKRPFILEKIEKDIYKRKYKLLKSNSCDRRLIELKQNIKKKIKKINPIIENPSSNNNKNIYKFIEKQKDNLVIESIKNKINNIIPMKRMIVKRQKSDIDLPLIKQHKTRRQLYGKDSIRTALSSFDIENNKINIDNITKNNIIESNDLFNEKSRIVKIRSILNVSKNEDESIQNEQKIYDINEINDKYNLELNIGSKPKKENIFNGKRYTIIGMLNKLFQYYSSESNPIKMSSDKDNKTSNYMNISNFNSTPLFHRENEYNNINSNITKSTDKYNYNRKSSSDIINNQQEIKGDDTNTFITKINISKETKDEKEQEFNVTKFINNRCSVNDVTKRNKEIIDNNKRVKIDCLMSKMEKNISIKKILYKYLDKTIYELQNDKSYTRLRELEKNIIEILKKEGY